VLTWELLQRTRQVLAVELDKRLAARLRDEFATMHATAAPLVIQGDILHLPPDALLKEIPPEWRASGPAQPHDSTAAPAVAYKVVANLPYAITSPVLRHFLESQSPPQRIVVLVQWEVARRITATPGDLSMLAHAVQMYATPEIVQRVPAHCFVPPPAVDSAVLRLHVRPAPAVPAEAVGHVFRLIKAAFLQPRKKLSNALPKGLAALGEAWEREPICIALEAAGVSPDRRAETVSLAEWAAVSAALRRLG
jgi:16S rRNA (adenine1518-N6/adenine1519-N6)-dimethyltransferase